MGKISSKIAKIRPHIKPLPQGLQWRDPVALIATWCHIGRLRPMPGTWGTLGGVFCGYAIQYVAGIAGLAVATVLLMWIGTRAAQFYGTASNEKDNQSIVVDEVVGVWIAGLPAGTDGSLWFWAFVLFRIFDILKPWPASYFDKRQGTALDVMLDDVVAGFYAMLGIAAAAVPSLLRM
jgi:phosphatidylglycerophosphatase A